MSPLKTHEFTKDGYIYLSAREVHIDVMDRKPTDEVHYLWIVIIGVLQCFPTSYHIVE